MKIVAIHRDAPTLIKERGSLLQGLVAMGHQVHALAPAQEPDVALRFEEMGVDYAMFPLSDGGFTPIADIGSLLHLKQVLVRIKPDMVLASSGKAVVYGPLAARMAWVGQEKKVYGLVTGLGRDFTEASGLKGRLLFSIAKSLHRAGFKSCDGLIFDQAGDEVFFRRLGIIGDHVRTMSINEADHATDQETADNAILSFMALLRITP